MCDKIRIPALVLFNGKPNGKPNPIWRGPIPKRRQPQIRPPFEFPFNPEKLKGHPNPNRITSKAEQQSKDHSPAAPTWPAVDWKKSVRSAGTLQWVELSESILMLKKGHDSLNTSQETVISPIYFMSCQVTVMAAKARDYL